MGSGLRLGIKVWLLLLSLFSAAPMALFSGYTVFQFNLQQRHGIDDELAGRTRAAAAAVALRVETLTATLTTLAKSDAVATDDLKGLYDQARRVAAEIPGLVAIVLIDDHNDALFNTNLDWGHRQAAMIRTENSGEVLATGRPALSEMFIGPIRKLPVAAIDVPIFKAGRVAYVLRMTVESRAFGDLMRALGISESWTMALVDQGGTIVARNRDAEKYVGTRTSDSVREAIARNDGRPFLSVTHDGVEVRAAVAAITPWQWSVVLGAPQAMLTAGIRHSLIALGLGAAVSFCIGLALVVWLSRHLVHEVDAASRASQAMGGGTAPPVINSTVRELETIGAALGSAIEREERVSGELSALADSERRLAEANATLESQAHDLERSNAELEQFAYVTSHDLREPLRMISAYIDLLDRRYAANLDADAREFIHFARDGAQRMDEMVRHLLEFSRIGRASPPFQPVTLAEIVETAWTNLAVAAAESGARLEIAGPLPAIHGSPPELVRLLQNLMGNALKFRSPERPPLLRLAATPDDGHWLISLADNGIGIGGEYFERIFQIFQRLHRREEYEGTGIGLAVCRKIVELHGGRIWVESEPGRGSTFFFTLKR